MTSVRSADTFEMGRVLSRAFGAMGRNVAMFIGMAVILSGIPQLISGVWGIEVNGAARAQMSAAALIAVAVGALLGLIGSMVLQAAVTRATVTDLNGETPGFVPCLKTGLGLILPMIGLAILAGLGVGVASLALIVPGVILWTAWSVAVPVYVQERIGITDSLSRSRSLTKGARWKIFALLLVFTFVIALLQMPAGLLTAATKAPPYIGVVITAIVGSIGAMVMATVQATIYMELREVKEGIAPQDLATIFA